MRIAIGKRRVFLIGGSLLAAFTVALARTKARLGLAWASCSQLCLQNAILRACLSTSTAAETAASAPVCSCAA